MDLGDFTLTPISSNFEIQNVFTKYTATSKQTTQKFTVYKANRNLALNMLIGEKFRKEIELIGMLDHPHIQVYYDTFYDAQNIYLFLEYEEKSFYSLFKEEGTMDDHSIFLIYKQIIDVVSYLHSIDIAHLDIQPESFFLVHDTHLKIGSFFNAESPTDKEIVKCYGTANFAAPETMYQTPYDPKKADVFACGILLLSMLKRELAIPGTTIPETKSNFLNNKIPIPSHFEPEIKALIQSMIEPDPNKRISIDQVYQSEWFKKHS